MSRDGNGLPSLTTWVSNIFAGFACGEGSAAEKDPCRQALLVSPTGSPSNGMCSSARAIAGLCRAGSRKCKAKQVRREGIRQQVPRWMPNEAVAWRSRAWRPAEDTNAFVHFVMIGPSKPLYPHKTRDDLLDKAQGL